MQSIPRLFSTVASSAVLRANACRTVGLVGAVLIAALAPAHGATIRLMPLGASATEGYESSDGNGYRKTLYDRLIAQGNPTDFVGSLRNGNAFDPDHEGHSGFRIDQVASLLNGVLAIYKPNLVTLHIGTNDMGQNYQVATAPDRLGAMIDQILAGSPGVTVVVAQIIPSADNAIQARINAYNARIPGIVQARANAGKHVYMVSMGSVTRSDLNSDGVHPTDGGYQKMANVFYDGVQQVIAKGWVTSFPWAGVYELQCVSSGQVLDVSGASTASSAAVEQQPYGTNKRDQLWNFLPTSNGYYQIRNANSALDLNVSGARTDDTAPVVQYPYGSLNNDQWLPSRNSDGSYTFYNRHSGLVLDMTGFSQVRAKQFEQYHANGGANQRFNGIPR